MPHVAASLLIAAVHGPTVESEEPRIEWPHGELTAALERIHSDVIPLPAPAALWPEDDADPAWAEARPWIRWADLLVKRASGELSHAELAELALVTLAQGRDEDAWRHLATLCDRSPEQAAGILPRFVPGVPEGFAAELGGLAPSLPDGVTLRPALPPPLGPLDPDVLLEARGVQVRGLRIGAATCDLLCDLRTDGMDLRFEHSGGGTANARAVLPSPPGFARWSEYADWDRQEELGAAHPVRLEPSEDPWRLWGRFQRARSSWPTRAPLEPTAQLRAGGLLLWLDPDDPAAARWAGLSDAVERSTRLRCAVHLSHQEPPRRDGPTPLLVRLVDPERRDSQCASLLGLLERAARAAPPSSPDPTPPR